MRFWVVGMVLVACGTGDGSSEPGGPAAMKIVESRAPALGRSATAPPINALEPYERLVRNFEKCGLEGNQIVSTCPALHAWKTEMAGVSSDIQVKVGAKMIGHVSPAVRVQA